MNILMISECQKNALHETRRVLDHFAERKGTRTWQTAITQQGLSTLKAMLRKKARKNTAVACYRIGGKNHSELLWIVGNAKKFNVEGSVPTHTTQRNIWAGHHENQWHSAEFITIVACIAALFHDFGKANVLFQKKLKSQAMTSEPYRHEWVSLRLFQAFVGDDAKDEDWLQRLQTIAKQDEKLWLQRLESFQDHPSKKVDNKTDNPFATLPPMARVVAWLIVTHHKLPCPPKDEERLSLRKIPNHLNGSLKPSWNSPQIRHYQEAAKDYNLKDLEQVWQFKKGLPIRSLTWCKRAQNLAKRALKYCESSGVTLPWVDNTFSLHLARLVLMLADHAYSASMGTSRYRDKQYQAFANTHKNPDGKRQLKQQLDEHLIGVSSDAFKIMKVLPDLRGQLSHTSNHKTLRKPTSDTRFLWQNKAFNLAQGVKKIANEQGFFGVNMASTGRGKTIANLRILYGLTEEARGFRATVALGLRTLTLQTGDALTDMMKLYKGEIATLIGSKAVLELHKHHRSEKEKESDHDSELTPVPGSDSALDLVEDKVHVLYESALEEGPLSQWIGKDSKANQLIDAPIVVCTIDHIMPATEGTRGGRQIAPMLRLLTSDLVLDEPDEFGLEDLPALCRLVNWAGMLGSRVLLSSATLSPELINALFEAYQQGRQSFQQARGLQTQKQQTLCAWFDENTSEFARVESADAFKKQHRQFIHQRIQFLHKQPMLRQAEIVPIAPASEGESLIQRVAETLRKSLSKLHHLHGTHHPHSGQHLSLGVVRMANIKPLIAVAKELLSTPIIDGIQCHFVIYHSQFPLLVRSNIEKHLDQLLNRKQPEAIWQNPLIVKALKTSKSQHHCVVVITSPVEEVGRDHDFDWAIVEPSSMRSIVQLAGRIQRHRQQTCDAPNMHILNQNIKGLQNQKPAFCQPGFENEKRLLKSYQLQDIVEERYLTPISAVANIQEVEATRESECSDLVVLEHNEIALKLTGTGYRVEGQAPTPDFKNLFAHQWLRSEATLTGLQPYKMPFRYSPLYSDDYFFLFFDPEEVSESYFKRWVDNEPENAKTKFKEIRIEKDLSQHLLITENYEDLLTKLVSEKDMLWEKASQQYGSLTLRKKIIDKDNTEWRYHPSLGVFDEFSEN
ncbi:MAG: type I-F CRISPR-associated helicase Cas3f [Pseudomonadota bacterium]